MTYDDSPLLPASPREALDQPIQQGEPPQPGTVGSAASPDTEAAARAAVTAASLANERRWATLDADEYDREAYEDRVDWEAKQP